MTAARGPAAAHGPMRRAGELAALKAEQTRLAAEVAELRALVQRWPANSASEPTRRAEVGMRFDLPEQKKLPTRW